MFNFRKGKRKREKLIVVIINLNKIRDFSLLLLLSVASRYANLF
jgi:hypothetical protein